MTAPRGLFRLWRRYVRDTRGAAAVEFALWLVAMTAPILSAIDLGFYVYQDMQVNDAAQIAAQDAWATCNTSTMWPVTANCTMAKGAVTDLNTAIVNGARSTSLGPLVSVTPGVLTGTTLSGSGEAWYCTDSTGALTLVGTPGTINTSGSNTAVSPATKPANCSAVAGSTMAAPGDYLIIKVSYTFHPIFKGVSMAALLPATLTQTARTRVY